jgi:hypothetical protein
MMAVFQYVFDSALARKYVFHVLWSSSFCNAMLFGVSRWGGTYVCTFTNTLQSLLGSQIPDSDFVTEDTMVQVKHETTLELDEQVVNCALQDPPAFKYELLSPVPPSFGNSWKHISTIIQYCVPRKRVFPYVSTTI